MTIEVGTAGIRVHAAVPGMIWTPFTASMLDPSEMEQKARKRHVSGRIGTAQEAAATAFLASDDASFVTGAVLTVDGGSSAGR